MADYENLLDSIDAVIKSNNRREITGQILQNTLHQIVGSLGENYQLAGFATPTLDPNSPDQNVFYVTDEAGVYTNFDNITLGAGLSFLMWKNEEWTSKTLDIVTADWVDEHYVSKAFLRKVFQFFDEDGVEIFPNDTESVVDNIKAMCGLWTNEYLSALGLGEGSTIPTTLAALNDVSITYPLLDGQALVYDEQSNHWVNATIQSGVDMSVVWAALAGATNEQINISHLTTALNDYVTATSLATTLQSYVTTSALATELANYASQSWVETNYISKAFFNSLFQAQDVNGNAITPNNSGQTTIDRLKILVGAYTEQYLSALGLSSGGGGGGSSTLAGLNDVTITYPLLDGQALIYDEQSGHWVNGAAISMSAVWTALAAATSEQINSSHLTSALSGYVTTSALASELANYVTTSSLATTLADYVTTSVLTTTLADYGSKTWIDNNYVSKAFFNRLFQAFAPLAEGQTEPTQVEPNDTTTTIDNIKAMFGLWTEQYLSALGLSAGGGGGYTLNEPLSSINNAALGTPSQANVAIVWNGTAWTYGTTMSSVSWNDVTNKPTTIAGYGITDALPLSGGTISGGINPNADSTINLGTATAKYHYIYAHRLIRLQSISKGDTYDSYKLDLPDKSGTIAVTSDIPTNNNQLTNGAGYITGITSSMVTTALGYTPANSSSLSSYLPLAGGTMTGAINMGEYGLSNVGSLVFKNGASSISFDRFGNISFGTGSDWWGVGSVLYVYKNGKVGIGKDNPSYKLDVNGGIYGDSFIKKNGTSSQFLKADGSVDSNSYVTSSGVTSVATGTGLTGGTITSTGTISINSTYQTYISNGNTAYGWGNHANAGYALASSLSNYLPLTGGTMAGTLDMGGNSITRVGAISFINGNSAISFDGYGNISLGSGSDYWGVGSTLTVNANGNVGIGTTEPLYKLDVRGNIATSTTDGSFVQIGGVRLVYDSINNAIKVVGSDGSTAANFYATGGVAALGAGSGGGGGTSYLPLSGGTMTGAISFGSAYPAGSAISFKAGEYLDQNGNFHFGSGSLYWYIASASDSALVKVTNTGDFGIGTDPSYKLDVIGAIASHTYLKKTGDNGNGYVIVGQPSSGYDDGIYYNTNSGANMWFRIQSISNIMISATYGSNAIAGRYDLFISATNGYVGIGTNTPSYQLHVAGAVGATAYNNTSDERLKDKIEDKILSIENIAKAPLFTFRWNKKGCDNDLHLGTSAQYWKDVLPEVVAEANDDMHTLSMQYGITAYASVVSVAREVLSQKEEIEMLKNKVNELGKENEYLREEIDRLKVA